MRTRFAAFAAVCALLCGSSAPATAQLKAVPSNGRVISFGDSLSDNGNLFNNTGNPPAPYFQGRFSNGPVWTELLNGSMNRFWQPNPFFTPTPGSNAQNINLAVGGARADNGANLNGPLPSVGTQVGAFALSGGTFGAGDLVTIQGGANDLFQYFALNGFGNNAGTVGAGQTAASALVQDVGLAIGLGAKKLLVANLPDLGGTPAYGGVALSASAGTLATQTYNGFWDSGLKQLAATNKGVNIIQMDVYTLVNLVKANPAAFGFSNVSQACLAVPSCVGGSAATQNSYLFWDTVHPTARAQALEAQFALLLLNSNIMAQAVSAVSNTAIGARNRATDETFERVSQWAYGSIARQNGLYATATGSFANENAHGAAPWSRSSFGGIRAGYDKQVGSELYGFAAAASAGSLKSSLGFGFGDYKADMTILHGDIYAAKHWRNFYLTGSIGGSFSQTDGRRDTGIPTVVATGNTSGYAATAAGEAGLMLRAGSVMLVPAARLAYVRSSIAGFSESAPLLAMSYGDHNFDGWVGSLKVRAITPFASALLARAHGFAEVGYERYLTARDHGFVGSLINNTALPFQVATSDPLANGLNFKAGLEGNITSTATLTVQYGLGLQEGQGQMHSGLARVKIPF
jgi:outer membrane lipase/esterase